jgi:hypothetical protein
MLAKTGIKPDDIFENWPEAYYEEESLARRKEYLEAYLKDHPSSESDQRRLNILGQRFSVKGKQEVDQFIRAWMMIKICENDRLSFLNRKSKEKELRENLRQLCILDSEKNDELIREWRDFARKYLIICCESRSYRTAAFGLIPMNDEKTAMRIAREVDLVTRIIPARFGLEEVCSAFRETVVDVYCSLLENGKEYWQSYLES